MKTANEILEVLKKYNVPQFEIDNIITDIKGYVAKVCSDQRQLCADNAYTEDVQEYVGIDGW